MVTRTVMNNFHSEVEHKTYEDLLGEFVQLWGIDVYYLPRTSESASGFDLLFGDDPTKKYAQSYIMEMYVQSVDNFEGGELFSKFGLTVKKQARFLLPRRAFEREVPIASYPRPREGDLSNFRALFEIKYVDEEHFFYDFGKKDFYGFSLIVEKFRYNDEMISTGVGEIDSTVNSIAFVYQFNMANTANTGTYQLGESIYQTSTGLANGTSTASATVVNWNLPSGILEVKDINGLFIPNAPVFGANSHAQWNVTSYNLIQSVNHPISDNQDIQTAVDGGVLNFSEENPFGQ